MFVFSFFFFLIVCFISYFVFSIVVLPHLINAQKLIKEKTYLVDSVGSGQFSNSRLVWSVMKTIFQNIFVLCYTCAYHVFLVCGPCFCVVIPPPAPPPPPKKKKKKKKRIKAHILLILTVFPSNSVSLRKRYLTSFSFTGLKRIKLPACYVHTLCNVLMQFIGQKSYYLLRLEYKSEWGTLLVSVFGWI